jgi:hypothetical protein
MKPSVAPRLGSGQAAWLLLAAFLLAYAPDVGHGFVKDDFFWIVQGRIDDLSSLTRTFFGQSAFYRPLVSLSFGVNHLAFGLHSYGYGLTNLGIAVGCAVLIVMLARRLGLPRDTALVAAAVWAFNFHGINMGVLWLSGRTSLLVTFFALAAAIAAAVRHRGWLFVATLLALLCKEEAMLLPVVFTLLIYIADADAQLPARAQRVSRTIMVSWPAWLAWCIYLVLRANAGSMTPASAPSYYQFSFEPAHIGKNVIEYADRSSTLAAAVVIAVALWLRRWPHLTSEMKRIVLIGAIWIVAGFGLTVWLPLRSSLYAVLPSVGAALIGGAVLTDLLRQASAAQRVRLLTVVVVLAFLLLPVYWSRNVRWVELADLTTATFRAIDRQANQLAPGTQIQLIDDPTTRANFSSAFSTLFPEAALLFFGERYSLWIVSPAPDIAASVGQPPPASSFASFRVREGVVERVP